jgi:hypothetical protein
MNLASLRPRAGADLQQLDALIKQNGWHSLLPASLPEGLLLQLVHDFRYAELSLKNETDLGQEDEALTRALLVIATLLTSRRAEVDCFELPLGKLAGAMQLYQYRLHKELVGRIINVPEALAADELIESLWRAAAH